MTVDLVDPAEVSALVDAEIEEYDAETPEAAALLKEFIKARDIPTLVTVNFSGGLTQTCFSVTRSNGNYRVIYMPLAGYFSLCVDSAFGPLDIGVHGPAIDCFASV